MAITQTTPESGEFNPTIVNDLFEVSPDSQFWVGLVAVGDTIERPEEYDALLRFRGNIYVHKLAFLGPDSLDEQGRESDDFDDRSDHFMVIENLGNQENVVGSIRLIRKRDESDLLPIEKHFPEVFVDPLPSNSGEVSRFISEHKDLKLTRHMITFSLIRAITLHAIENDIESFYCIIEEPLRRRLEFIGIPLEVLGDSKRIDELGGDLIPVHIKPQQIIESLNSGEKRHDLLRSFFENDTKNMGTGYYDNTFMGGTDD